MTGVLELPLDEIAARLKTAADGELQSINLLELQASRASVLWPDSPALYELTVGETRRQALALGLARRIALALAARPDVAIGLGLLPAIDLDDAAEGSDA
jgi:hypothetical protein